MTIGLPMLLAGILLAPPQQALEFTLLTGGRTAPESAVELENEEYEQEFELEFDSDLEVHPLVAFLADGDLRFSSGVWLGGYFQSWGYLSDEAPSSLRAGGRLGWGRDVAERLRVDVGGRYSAEAVPLYLSASSGRGDFAFSAGRALGVQRLEVTIQGLGRHYPYASAMGFQEVSSVVRWQLDPEQMPLLLRLEAGWQGNRGWTSDSAGNLSEVTGWQGRLRTEAGYSRGQLDFSLGYRLYLAQGGAPESGVRSQFTLLGDYADDADALSSGGFLQHRLDLTLAWGRGPWNVSASALGRLRAYEVKESGAGPTRTLHTQLEARRRQSTRWELSATLGLSAAAWARAAYGEDTETEDGDGEGETEGLEGDRRGTLPLTTPVVAGDYVDVYGWLGIRWHLG